MKILFVASECVPFCKTGGLADVVGALPKELRKKRHDIRIMLPKYKAIRGQEFNIKETGEVVRIPIGTRIETGDVRVSKTEKGVPVYFINHEGYFGRSGLYRSSEGDYPDNAERFGFFSRAVLEACKAINFRPDVIHCHDWQTGLVPAFLRVHYATDAFFQHTATVFTIHNIAYQGVFPKDILPALGFTWSEFTMDKMEFYDHVSFLKAGLTYADKLTTVSPTYARQIQNAPEFGRGMEGTLRARARDLDGILNGLDLDEWNPAQDPFLAKPYHIDSREGRKDCKASLQQHLKLTKSPRTPLLGLVARLDQQKGIDLLAQIVPELMEQGVQIVILGQGDPVLLERMERFEQQYPRAFRIRSDFNEPLAHHIYGGSDVFLMPSRFEPCGLGQLIAMRYGSIPVVMNTGGLSDTVIPIGPNDTGTGFVFYETTAQALHTSIRQALKMYTDETAWNRLQTRAMQTHFSWEESAQRYVDTYRRALGRGGKSRRSIKIS
jgi:starch synthase